MKISSKQVEAAVCDIRRITQLEQTVLLNLELNETNFWTVRRQETLRTFRIQVNLIQYRQVMMEPM